MEHIEPGQVFVTAPPNDDFRERTGVVRVVEAPDDHPDALVEKLEPTNDGTTSMSPRMFVARLHHRE